MYGLLSFRNKLMYRYIRKMAVQYQIEIRTLLHDYIIDIK